MSKIIETIILIGCAIMFGFWAEAGKDFYKFMFNKNLNKKENCNGKCK